MYRNLSDRGCARTLRTLYVYATGSPSRRKVSSAVYKEGETRRHSFVLLRLRYGLPVIAVINLATGKYSNIPGHFLTL